MAWVYILRGNNNRFYIGSTNNLSRRLLEHQTGRSKYTSEGLPIKLVFSQQFINLASARKVEYWLKKQKSAYLIEKIIAEGTIFKNFN